MSAGIVFMREALVRFSRHKPNFAAGLMRKMTITCGLKKDNILSPTRLIADACLIVL
jgi:hypothetical protein